MWVEQIKRRQSLHCYMDELPPLTVPVSGTQGTQAHAAFYEFIPKGGKLVNVAP